MRGMELSRGLNPYSQSSQHVTVPTAGPSLCFGSGHRAFRKVKEQRSACLKKLPRGLSVHFQHSTTKGLSQVNECVDSERKRERERERERCNKH